MLRANRTTYEEALSIASSYDVNTEENSIVLYSISFLPTKQNKYDALEFIKNNHGKMLVDDTKCGMKLIELGLDDGTSGLSEEEVREIWGIASERFIKQARGSVTAFVKGSDKRSIFRSKELPELLKNPLVNKINGMDKFEFAENFDN
ncbi:MAG: hypothetical protein LBR70_03085 [Lactobacillaceae bacterium]|jgi:hypothetical protein|nr:hypothetical protein [Lactobacillaceae bacterium]